MSLRAALGMVLVLTFALVQPSPAATFPDLYTVSVQVDSDAAAARTDVEVIRRGMELLLTRITGRQRAAELPGAADLVRQADDYLASFLPLGDEVRVGFRRSDINAALTRLNLPIWGAERPATLLWLAVDLDGGQRAELAFDSESSGTATSSTGLATGRPSDLLDDEAGALFEAFADELVRAADERGLPVVLPLLDAADRRQVRFADVWGGFDRQVAMAAERYDVDAILIARAAVTEFGPEIRWILQNGEQRQEFATPSVRQGIDALANLLATELATAEGPRPRTLTIRGIEAWSDYGRVFSFLDSLSVVESHEIESMHGDDLVLRIVARGDDRQLQQLMTLDGEFSLPEEPLPGPGLVIEDQGLVLVPAWRNQDEESALQ